MSQGFSSLCGESGMLQQVGRTRLLSELFEPGGIDSRILCTSLSFGTGGKDKKTGEVSKGWGYYEVSTESLSLCFNLRSCISEDRQTIAGGSGAGPNWHGTSGVHVHMTNTRITDPEILERRYRKPSGRLLSF